MNPELRVGCPTCHTTPRQRCIRLSTGRAAKVSHRPRVWEYRRLLVAGALDGGTW